MKKFVSLILTLTVVLIVFALPITARADYTVETVSGVISTDTTWNSGTIYVMDGDITINSGVTLTIDAGAIVKVNRGRILVYGTLDISGSDGNMVYITSYRDDSVGGDTNEDGTATSPSAEAYLGIKIYNGGSADISYADIRYGGAYSSYDSWYGMTIHKESGGNLAIDNSSISGSNRDAMNLQGTGTVLITDTNITNAGYSGVSLSDCAASITGGSFTDCGKYGISVGASADYNGALPSISNADFSGNTLGAVYLAAQAAGTTVTGGDMTGECIQISGGTIARETTLSSEHTYYTDNRIYVTSDVTISAGTVIKLDHLGTFRIQDGGSLSIDGTESSRVTLTSRHDTSIGEDTSDGTPVAAGQWEGITIYSGGTAEISYADIKYSGYYYYNDSTVANCIYKYDGGNLSIDNSLVYKSNNSAIALYGAGTAVIEEVAVDSAETYGVYLKDCAASISGGSFTGCLNYGIYVDASASYAGTLPSISNADFSGNTYGAVLLAAQVAGTTVTGGDMSNECIEINTGTIARDTTLSSEHTYYIDGRVSITSDVKIAAGTVIKLYQLGTFRIQNRGNLSIEGTESNRVTLTSYLDTSVGEDIGDGTAAAEGQWEGITIYSGGTAEISYADIKYSGYYYYNDSTVANCIYKYDGGNLSIDNSLVYKSNSSAIALYGTGTAEIEAVTIDSAVSNGIYINAASPTITKCTITGNATGIYITGTSSPVMSGGTDSMNVISGNTSYGINNASGTAVDATNNYWGDSTGPYHATINPLGQGNAVSDNVTFMPFYAGDATSPTLTAGAIYRTSGSAATVRFISDEAGTCYYEVTDSAAAPSNSDLTGWTSGGTVSADTTVALSPAGLTSGARYVHIVVRDAAGNVSEVLTVSMPYDLYYFDDFESYAQDAYPEYFFSEYSGAGTGEQKVISAAQADETTGNVFRLKGKSSWASDQRVTSLPSGIEGTVIFELDMKAVSGNGGGIALGQNNVTWTGGIVRVEMNNGVFRSIVGDSSVTASTVTYELGTWYHVKIELDYTNRTFNYYVGETKVNSAPLSAHATYTLQYFGLYAGNSSSGDEMYFDNVKVYTAAETTSYALTAPSAVTQNGVTAAVTFSPASPVGSGEAVTATVTLTGTATAGGTHTINLTSTKAGLTSNPQTVTVSVGQDLTATPVTKTFTFTMPAEAVDDFVLTNTFTADTTAPGLTAGAAKRTSDTAGTVKFTSDEAGTYYYEVVDSGEEAPTIDTAGSGTACGTTEQTISLSSLTAGDKDVYIVVKDGANNVSDPLKIELHAFASGSIGFTIDSLDVSEGEGTLTASISLERTGGTDGAVSVSYSFGDGTAEAGTHYTDASGTVSWADEEDGVKYITLTLLDDSDYDGYKDFEVTLSSPTGSASITGTNPLTVTISDDDNPPPPTGLTAAAGNGEVTLSWNSVEDVYYKVYCSESSGSFSEGDYVDSVFTGTSYTVEGLTNGTLYYFAVKSGHDVYYSNYSDETSATPTAPTGGGGNITYFSIIASAGSGGSIDPSGSVSVQKNLSKTFSITPESGYVIADVLVDGVSVGAVTEYMFSGITENHTITAWFDHPSRRFTDVDGSLWYREGIDFVLTTGLFNGTSDTTFEPNTEMTRAMLVTVLWRLDNEPDTTLTDLFADIAAGTWYTDAVAWASENGIVEGYDANTFGPDDSITREQMAAILYRYASNKGYDVTAMDDLSGFGDAGDTSDWALAAMQWAVADGLIQGVGGNQLDPAGHATRAQVATILMRFVQNVVE